MEKVVYPALVDQITMLGSPSAARDHMVKYYMTSPTTDTPRLDIEWSSLEMNVGEVLLVFFSLTKPMRHSQARHGVIMSDAVADRHYVCCPSFDYEVQKSVLLGIDVVDFDVLEHPVLTAHGEMELAWAKTGGSQGSALVAAVSGGTGGGVQNGR